jgi:hypothetical protein
MADRLVRFPLVRMAFGWIAAGRPQPGIGTVLVRGDAPPKPPARLVRGDAPPEPPARRVRGRQS